MRIRSVGDLAAAAKGRRLGLGLTQEAVADRAGVSRKWVSDFERAKARVDLGSVLRVLAALELPILVGATSPPKQEPGSPSIDLDELLERYARLGRGA